MHDRAVVELPHTLLLVLPALGDTERPVEVAELHSYIVRPQRRVHGRDPDQKARGQRVEPLPRSSGGAGGDCPDEQRRRRERQHELQVRPEQPGGDERDRHCPERTAERDAQVVGGEVDGRGSQPREFAVQRHTDDEKSPSVDEELEAERRERHQRQDAHGRGRDAEQ